MDLKIIRVKRALESEPLEQLSINHKKRKLDSPITLSMVATVKSKEESLAPIIKDLVSKCKKEKLQRLQERKGLSHPDLFKYRTNAAEKVGGAHTASAARRYQVVSKYRGITELDDDSEKYLASTDRFKVEFPNDDEPDEETTSSDASSSKDVESIKTSGLEIEIVDVDEIPNEEDVICMNGTPLQTTYLYDIFLTQVPQGCSVDDFSLSQVTWQDARDENYADSDDSEDSNAENYYANDYPDEESTSSDDEADDDRGVWDNELSSRMQRSLGFSNEISYRPKKKRQTFMGTDVPEHLSYMVDWGALQSDQDSVSSIDGEEEYPEMVDE